MADLVPSKSVSITELVSRLDSVKFNPSNMQRIMLDYLAEVVDGKVNIVDPTNPFIFLMEGSAVNTSLAISETMIGMRKQHARLAQTPEDVYMHMSDTDFINRFATPADTEFTIAIQTNDIINKLVYDSAERCYKGIIPRDTEFVADGIYYTLQYPIIIRKFDNGGVQISYDADKVSPVQSLSTNMISYTLRKDVDQVSWVFFDVKLKQFKVETNYYPVQETSQFSQDIVFNDKYYYARVYYRNNTTNNTWKEIYTTHSDQVYDITKATALLAVTEGNLNISVPLVYTKTGMISGEIRVDLFTTKGNISIDYSAYKLESFGLNLKAIDEDNDINEYTNAIQNLSYYCFNKNIVSGGKDSISFEALRERTIFNSNGPQQLPITNKQVATQISDSGFDLVVEVDTITNRIFLATRTLSQPRNKKLLTAANIGINTLVLTTDYNNYKDYIVTKGKRTIIKSNCIFQNNNGILKVLDKEFFNSISVQELVKLNNSNQYLYNPFYYVLDSSLKELEVRAYNLDFPFTSNLNFISQNQSLALAVNTDSYAISKIKNGYRLTITTKSGNFYKQVPDSSVGLHIGFYPANEKQQAYINADLIGTTAIGERIWQADIITSFDIDSDDLLEVTNASMFGNETLNVNINLASGFNIYHTTTSITNDYVKSSSDDLIASFMLPAGSACITHETLFVTLGEALKNLWVRSRTIPGTVKYKTYPEDIQLVYETDIYDKDTVTGQFFDIVDGAIHYRFLHRANEPVVTEDGEPVYLHRKGDVILDQLGQPMTEGTNALAQELDLLLVDAKYYFATDSIVSQYRTEVIGELVTWIVDNLGEIQSTLLEQTKIYFYPKTSLGSVKVSIDGSEYKYINSEQSITVDLLVNEAVYNDYNLRKTLESLTVQTIDSLIDSSEVNIKVIDDKLKSLYKDSVISFSVKGLGGGDNNLLLTLEQNSNRLCLKKKLLLQPDNSIVITEDVTVNFTKV